MIICDFNIIFCSVPWHMDINGKEKANTASKQASSFEDTKIPYSDKKKNQINNILICLSKGEAGTQYLIKNFIP